MISAYSNINVLLVEDNPGDVLLIEKQLEHSDTSILAENVNLTHKDNLDDAIDVLENEVIDIILLDLGLPKSTGLDTLSRMLDYTIEYPIIVLTGLDDTETAVQAVQQGAQDYIPKDDIDGAILLRAMRYAIERKENQLELKRQNERLDNFASVVSHDLRNPLDIARGYTEVAQETGNDEHFDTVVNALNRMNNMIDDVLTLAREGSAVDEEELEPINLDDLLDDTWGVVDTKDCQLERPDTLPQIEGDRSRVRQIFENLFRNSVTHAGNDVTISVGVLDGGYGFYIEDNGPGIDDDIKDNLFEQGFTTDDEGTGFGLNIVKEIANAHGWDVRVVDAESGGARFEVSDIDSIRD